MGDKEKVVSLEEHAKLIAELADEMRDTKRRLGLLEARVREHAGPRHAEPDLSYMT